MRPDLTLITIYEMLIFKLLFLITRFYYKNITQTPWVCCKILCLFKSNYLKNIAFYHNTGALPFVSIVVSNKLKHFPKCRNLLKMLHFLIKLVIWLFVVYYWEVSPLLMNLL
jgi:hypothetical protein